MRFYVNEHVLIPRPETEELVNWVVEDSIKTFTGAAHPPDHSSLILDIGTGSGCIPVAIKKRIPHATLLSCDISEEALVIARANATRHEADIQLRQLDFLDPKEWVRLPSADIIVSNPPYIPITDKKNLPKNVADFEPVKALFVEGSDAILFYRAIAAFAKEKLVNGGSIFVEMHEQFSAEVSYLFSAEGFAHIEIKNDLQGKARMLKAT
jgi:release factor glutamine methyltransferase